MEVKFEGTLDEVVQKCSEFVSRFGGTCDTPVSQSTANPATQTGEEKRGRGRPPKTPTDSPAAVPPAAATPSTAVAADDLFGSEEPAPAKQLTPDEFKLALREAIGKHGQPAVVKVLGEFGAKNVAEVNPANYAAILAKLS